MNWIKSYVAKVFFEPIKFIKNTIKIADKMIFFFISTIFHPFQAYKLMFKQEILKKKSDALNKVVKFFKI